MRIRGRLWQRLASISVVLIVPLGLTTYFLVSEQSSTIVSIGVELSGIDVLQPLDRLLVDVVRYQRQAARGTPDVATSADIDGQLSAIMRLAGPLTNGAAPGQSPAALAGTWAAVQTGREQNTLVADIYGLISHVGDTSQLFLDSELDTYYTIDAFQSRMPTLVTILSTLDNDLHVGAPASSVVRDTTLAGVARDGIDQSMRRAFAAAPSHSGDRMLQPTVQPGLEALDVDINELTSGAGVSSAVVDRAITTVADLWPTLLDQERTMLLTRLDRAETTRLWQLLSVGAVLLSVIALNVLLSRRIVRDLGQVSRAARDFAHGDFSRRLELPEHDEIGSLAANFNAMAAQLAHVTELRVRWEAAKQAEGIKNNFLATVSHELRTPLNAVIGMTDLLLASGALTGEQRDYTETIRTSGDELLRLINDILDFIRSESDKLSLVAVPFELRACLDSALEVVAATASRKHVELVLLATPACPEWLIGDSGRLRQILVNLLGNALKFTDSGEVVLSVGLDTETGPAAGGQLDVDSGPVRLNFGVRDTGIGFAPERADQLFEPFDQLDQSISRRHGGTGLGLAISKRLVEAMGGRIWAVNNTGPGATFHFTITAERTAVPDEAQLPSLRRRRVLVVDDNATNRRLISQQAQSWDMLVRATGDQYEALHWIAQHEPFDIGLLDLRMPGMDGVQLARRIREYRDRDHLPLVLLRPRGSQPDPNGLAEFAGQLFKPIKQSTMHDMIAKILLGGATSAAPTPPVAVPTGRAGLRILVAEDNPVNQRLIVAMLNRLGHGADLAVDGFEALDRLREQDYDVVFMDIQMPGMDGLTATRRIVSEFPDRLPAVVAMTAAALPGDRETCLAAGMNDYLSKPVRMAELSEVLARLNRLPTTDPVVDQRTLDDLVGSLGADAVTELVDIFVIDAPQLIDRMRDGVANHEPGALHMAAHTLRSSSGALGARVLSDLCVQLEESSGNGAWDQLAALVASVDANFREVVSRLEEASRLGEI